MLPFRSIRHLSSAVVLCLAVGLISWPGQASTVSSTGDGWGDEPRSQARNLIEEGEKLLEAGQTDRGCLRLELAFSIAPEWWYAAYALGRGGCSGQQGDATYLLERAGLSRGGGIYAVEMALARLFWTAGQWERAARHYQQAIELARGSAEAMLELGELLIQSGQTGAGIAWVKKALYLSPSHVVIRSRLGTVCEANGELSVAEEQFRYLAIHGNNRRRGLVELSRFYARHARPAASGRVSSLLKHWEAAAGENDLPDFQFVPAEPGMTGGVPGGR